MQHSLPCWCGLGVEWWNERMTLRGDKFTAAWRGALAAGMVGVAGLLLGGCSQIEIQAPHSLPLSKDAQALLSKKKMTEKQPIFVRIFKEESELEVWKLRDDGRFYHFKTYPICNWSGELGPKFQQGDKQAPEGFYSITPKQMNPNSAFHLAFNMGYPNAFDRAHKRTGDALMVHGKCKSAGCYAMTDALIEEIYALAREALAGGQDAFQAHAFPFRMTAANIDRHAKHKAAPFWATLKEGYDYFEATRQLPAIAVCNKQYLVNVKWKSASVPKVDPESACPAFEKPPVEPFTPPKEEQQASVIAPDMAPGPKMRSFASTQPTYGLGAAFGQRSRPTSSAVGFGLNQ
jgi:murein L,D-transpeptidase YafK